MRKIIVIAIITIALSAICNAQNIKGFVTAGTTLSQIDGDEVYGFKKLGFVGSVGAVIPLESKDRWLVSIETMFSQRGAREERSKKTYHYNVTLPYVEIPVMLHFADQKGGWTFGLGLSSSRLVSTPKETFHWDTTRFIPNTETPFRKNDFSVIADIRFTIWRGLKFNFRYQYSIAPIKKDWEFMLRSSNGDEFNEKWTRNAYNNSLSARLIWVFNDNSTNNYKKKKR